MVRRQSLTAIILKIWYNGVMEILIIAGLGLIGLGVALGEQAKQRLRQEKVKIHPKKNRRS